MKIKYTGPADAVNVVGYGPHLRGEIREYPDEFAAGLLASSVRQRFEQVNPGSEGDGSNEADTTAPEGMTVEQLKADLGLFVEADALKGKKKAELAALWASTRDSLKALTGM